MAKKTDGGKRAATATKKHSKTAAGSALSQSAKSSQTGRFTSKAAHSKAAPDKASEYLVKALRGSYWAEK